MDWQKRTPIISLLLIVALAAVPFVLNRESAATADGFETAQAEARKYIAANPRLEVDRRGELTLGAEWFSELRETQALSGRDGNELPARMLARAQARLDGLIDTASAERMKAEPSWRFGVLDRRSPAANLFAHAFVHENVIGAVLAIGILCLAGVALERVWGSVVFGLFALATVPVVAQFYLALDSSSGMPWSGASGLAAALLGAYCIRGLGGVFTVPGWAVVPFWLGLEVFAVRGLSVDQLGAMPWATVFGAFGLGALVAGVLKMVNVEKHLAEQEAEKENETNPILTRASRLNSDGDPYQAFDLLQAAWRDNPSDDQVAEAYYATAVEIDQPEAASEAIVPIIRDCLRNGQVDEAVEHWFPLASRSCEVRIEATAAVRLGEAMLDAGHPEEALFSLRLALENGPSAAHATRIVHVARDLDADLARRAAQVAIADPNLDPISKQELEAIASLQTSSDAEADFAESEGEGSVAEVAPPSTSQLDRRVSAEHQAVEMTAFPRGDDRDLNDPSGEPDLLADEMLLDDADLALSDGGEDFSDLDDFDELDFEDATDRDRTALDDSTEERTSPMLSQLGGEGEPLLEYAADDNYDDDYDDVGDEGDAIFEEEASPFREPSADSAAVSSLLTTPGSAATAPQTDGSISATSGDVSEAAPKMISLRGLRVIDAIPVEATRDAIEIDTNGRGKSKLPISRIQAVALAAVSGIVSRPVLIIDCVLNWSDDIGSPIKAIRFRSDQFDPCQFAEGQEDALSALLVWVSDLQASSRASALPNREALEGELTPFDSLESYEREVLMAKRIEDS